MTDNVHKYGARWSFAANGRACPQPLERFVADAYQAQNDGAGFNVDLNIGDIVKEVSDGSVALANTTESPYAVIVGIARVFDGSTGQVKPMDRVPGGTDGGGNLDRQTRVLVVPIKWGIWDMDCDDNVTATTEAAYQAFIGENVDFVMPGDNTSNPSRPTADPFLDISGHNTLATLALRIVGISKTMENQDFSGANVKLSVQANISTEAGSAATTVTGT